MRPRLGDQRYLAVWCDSKSLLAEASRSGWNASGGDGPLSYVEADDHCHRALAPDFDTAVRFAHARRAEDFFGCPRVYLQEFGPADVPPPAMEWEGIKIWDVNEDGSATELPTWA